MTPTAVTSTSITVAVPSGATTGAIKVTAPSGSVTTAKSFVVSSTSAPTITSFTTGTSTPTIAIIGGTLTITGTNFDTTYSKVSINGQYAQITSATATTLKVVVPPASSGKVVVETPIGSVTSSNDLIIAPPPFAATTVSSGRTTIGASPLTIPEGGSGTVALALFDAAAGQKVTVYLNNSGVSGCPFITLLLPSGAPFFPGGTSCASANWIGPLVIPQAGTYSAELQPTSSSGSFQAQVFNVPPDVTVPVTIGGSTATLTITVPGQHGSFTFAGTSGQRVSLLLNFSGMGTCSTYSVINPDTSVMIAPTHTCANGLYVNSPFVLAQTGTYTISLVPDPGGTGTITAQLFSVPADTTQSVSIGGSSAPLSITAPGQHGSFTFSGTSGQKVSLLLNFAGMTGCSTYTVTNPDSSVLFGPTFTCANGLYISSPFVLSQTGTYTIAIVPDLSGGMPLREQERSQRSSSAYRPIQRNQLVLVVRLLP